ncbi:E3 ubiquitin-protein ligase TRIM45-like [Mytilus trossulus]|uniref:E3 ubiquitin-protein ligase TRIM45-like n=1 Tax=Mytilus trossulus TaxID=6551 RepID=UPI003003B29E
MATPIKDTTHFDDLLTCTICLETFKVPKYLPCLHTFCESCINTYIVSSVEKGKITEGFTCPVCRKIVSSVETLERPELWATTLPTNHFVTSMLDKRAIQKAEKMCDSCQLNKESTKAKSWCTICEEAFCEQCEKCHKNFKMSARHKLLNIQEMKSGDTPFEVCEVQSCDEHTGKIIEFYCLDHSQPCCTSCATLSHRKCENVTSIQEAASGIKQSKAANDLSEKLTEHSDQLNEIIENRNSNLFNVNNSIEVIETSVSNMKTEILKHIDKMEETMKVELTSTKKQVGIKLKDEIDACVSYKSAVKNWKDMFDSVLNHGSEQQCLMEINKMEPKISDLAGEMINLKKNIKTISVVFSPSSPIADLKNTKTFGSIKVDESPDSKVTGMLGISNIDFRTGNIKILQVIDVCKGRGPSSGIFIQNYLLFTIRGRNKVVKYKFDGNSLLSELLLPNAPEDIAAIVQLKVAISSTKKALFVVDSDKMTLLQTLTFPFLQVYGLSCVNEKQLIIGSSNKLTWLNFPYGEKINERQTASNSNFVLSLGEQDCIYGICNNSVNYSVGDTTKFTYTNTKLSGPRGIGVDMVGNIYIAGYNSANIHQITNEGSLIRIIPATTIGIESPWTIRFAPSSNKLIVTCLTSGKASLCEII